VGETCGTHGGGERCLQGFGWLGPKVRDHLEERRRWEDNIKLAQDRVQWRAFMSTEMDLGFP
jgi:hypothetical protein